MHDFLADIRLVDIIVSSLTAIVGWGVINLKELNENIKLLMMRVNIQEKDLDDHEARIRAIERH